MDDDELLALIRATPWMQHVLTQCEFELGRAADGPVEPIHLDGDPPLEMVAGDGTGGAYLLVGAPGVPRPVVFADSEGRGGLVATSLHDALVLVLGVPFHVRYATDAGPDGGAALRARLDRAQIDLLENWPEADVERARVRAALGLPELDDDRLATFRASCNDERHRPVSDEGNRYEPLLAVPPGPA